MHNVKNMHKCCNEQEQQLFYTIFLTIYLHYLKLICRLFFFFYAVIVPLLCYFQTLIHSALLLRLLIRYQGLIPCQMLYKHRTKSLCCREVQFKCSTWIEPDHEHKATMRKYTIAILRAISCFSQRSQWYMTGRFVILDCKVMFFLLGAWIALCLET